MKKELVILIGPSGCGKDYVAQTQFLKHQVLKLNSYFKRLFEKDHLLRPGTCDDKTQRSIVLKHGPKKGNTLSDAMVQCYTESLSPNIESYGAKFAGKTLFEALSFLIYEPKSYVITDLRKPSEAIMLKEFAMNQLGYKIRPYYISSNNGQAKQSDAQLEEVSTIMSPVNVITNDWDLND
jgi:hypothetical protein